MENIRELFLTKTIPDLLSSEFDMPYIKFVFDKETLIGLKDYLDKKDANTYYKGLKSIEYLFDIYNDQEEGRIDELSIQVHDSNKFFNLLEEIIKAYSKGEYYALVKPYNFIRSIWLRMGIKDINNVEEFLERQLKFIENDKLLTGFNTICELSENESLGYSIRNNEDWFETNKSISFGIYKDGEDIFDTKRYYFPAIHYGLSKENNVPTCFIYGIQTLNTYFSKDKTIKEKLQPIRKKLRNKNVSSDFIIGLSSFLDFLYDNGIKDIEIPTLQVFNYMYHEHLSDNIKNNYNSYSDEEKQELEKSFEEGKRDDKELDYIHTKGMVSRFVDKQDIISHNKTERLIETVYELINLNPSIELVSEPFINGENMVLHLNGKTDILKDYNKKERTI